MSALDKIARMHADIAQKCYDTVQYRLRGNKNL